MIWRDQNDAGKSIWKRVGVFWHPAHLAVAVPPLQFVQLLRQCPSGPKPSALDAHARGHDVQDVQTVQVVQDAQHIHVVQDAKVVPTVQAVQLVHVVQAV